MEISLITLQPLRPPAKYRKKTLEPFACTKSNNEEAKYEYNTTQTTLYRRELNADSLFMSREHLITIELPPTTTRGVFAAKTRHTFTNCFNLRPRAH